MTVVFVNAKLIVCEDGSFGIAAEVDGEVLYYRSLSLERERVERLVRLINDGEVSRLHIAEIIEDFLG
ncbi:MAG: hypothetical protein E7592_02850 [Ruminococcaceae bacterium]|nr:hypothetical protein [Oscillospiraceae bacterium]